MELFGGPVSMKLKWVVCLILFWIVLIGIANAASDYNNISSSRSVTTKGPYDILVSLGIEYVITPVAAAYYWYNLISIGLLVGITSIASRRNTGQVAVLIPIIVGMCMYFGWLHSPNPAMTYGMVAFSAIIAAAIYMNDSLHINFGIPGPGSKFLNIVFFMIILQAIVGFVNTEAIWGDNNVGIQTAQYTNVDLQKEVTSMANSGGLFENAVSALTILPDIAISVIKVMISIVISIFLFGVALIRIFPFLDTPIAIAFLAVITVVLDYLFIKYMADVFYFKSIGVNDV